MASFLIADDHSMIRVGLKFLIKENFLPATVYEAKDGEELVDCIKKQDVDIVLMDLNMPSTDPQAILQTVLVLKPGLPVIIFSMNKEEIFGLMYLKIGAMAYLQKDCEKSEIINAIKCVMAGEVYISKEMQAYYHKRKDLLLDDSPFSMLTKKELEVLRHLAKGSSVINIGKTMNLSSSTIGTHKANIFEKLKIDNMFELQEMIQLYPLA